MPNTRMRLFAATVLVALVAAACGGDAGDRRLTVYSGRTENLIGPLLERFTAQTGIEVEVRYGQSADLALLIDQEGDRSPADVFISQSPGAVGYLAERGRLRPLDAGVLSLVPSEFRNEGGLWVGLTGRVRTLVYNRDLVTEAELPGSVFDLTDERYRGAVAVAPANGSFQDFVTAMRELEGDDATLAWLRGLADNGAPTYANNTSIVQAVARGDVPMGLVNHYYNIRAKAEDPTLPTENYFFPGGDLGSLLIVTAASIVDAGDQPEAATELIRFLLGEDAQSFFAGKTFEYPLAAGVEPASALPPLSSIEVATYDFDRLGGGLERTTSLIDASGLEAP